MLKMTSLCVDMLGKGMEQGHAPFHAEEVMQDLFFDELSRAVWCQKAPRFAMGIDF